MARKIEVTERFTAEDRSVNIEQYAEGYAGSNSIEVAAHVDSEYVHVNFTSYVSDHGGGDHPGMCHHNTRLLLTREAAAQLARAIGMVLPVADAPKPDPALVAATYAAPVAAGEGMVA